jgi:hypothetical protein
MLRPSFEALRSHNTDGFLGLSSLTLVRGNLSGWSGEFRESASVNGIVLGVHSFQYDLNLVLVRTVVVASVVVAKVQVTRIVDPKTL